MKQVTRSCLTRRDFLRISGVSSAALLLAACSPPQVSTAGRPGSSVPSTDFAPDLELSITATSAEASILPGAVTQVLHYATEVLSGAAETVDTPGNYLGPILRLRQGQRVRIHFKNELDEESIIHWHGLIVPAAMDGHPRLAIAPGETFVYEFEVQNRAGTYWFHPHPHLHTGRQVYAGLAGLFLVSDEEEAALNLPSGEYDLPLVIQDRQFDGDNQLVYLGKSVMDEASGGMGGTMGGMMGGGDMNAAMDRMMGVLGDRILVNGRPDATLDVATRAYRLRLLNASTARIYKLGWRDGTPLTAIGTDDGLLERPVQKPYLTFAPGQRRELWVDFSDYPVGTELRLESLPFEGVEAGGTMMEGMGGMSGMNTGDDPALPQGAPFPVLTVRVASEASETDTLPERLTTVETLDASAAVNADEPRVFALAARGMEWTINGETYDMGNINPDTQVALGTTELWEFANLADAGMMTDFMAHPMHVHGVHFQVVEREVDPAYRAGWETLINGTLDEGWHDVVLVMPGERVRVAARFTEPGLFVQHCHILEHEDLGMMRNFLVT